MLLNRPDSSGQSNSMEGIDMPKNIKDELYAVTCHIREILSNKMTAIDKAVLCHLAERRKEIISMYKQGV